MAAAESSSSTSNSVVDHRQVVPMLDELLDSLHKEYDRLLFEEADENSSIVDRVHGFSQSESRYNHKLPTYKSELLHLIELIQQLRTQSGFLCTFIDDIRQWSDADRVLLDIGSLIHKAEARADEIAKKIYNSGPRKRIQKKGSSLTSLTSEVRRWTWEMSDLNPEIVGALESILGSFSSLQIHSPLPHLFLWIKFVKCTMGNMRLANVTMKIKEVPAYFRAVTSFISRVHKVWPSDDHDRNQAAIQGFFVRVGSAVFRAACLTSVSWFGAMDDASSQIQELFYEIFPSTPESLNFLLEFLKAVQEISHGELTVRQLADVFYDSFAYNRSRAVPKTLDSDLTDWLIFLINNAGEEPVNQDKVCFLAEVKHVIVETIPALNSGHDRNMLSLEILHWLLQADRFLQNAISDLPEADQIDNLVNSWAERQRNYDQLTENVIFTNKIISDVKSLCQSYHAKEVKEHRARGSISLLLSKIVLFRAKPALMYLSDHEGNAVSHCKDQLQALLQGLELFISFVNDKHAVDTFPEEKIFRSIEAVARRIITLRYSFLGKEITKETAKNEVTDLLEKVKNVKKELGKSYSQIPRNIFPKQTAGTGFLDSLLDNLLELLKRDIPLVPWVRVSMEKVKEDLFSLRKERIKLLESKDLASNITEMTNDLDYIIDSIEVGRGSLWKHLVWLYQLQEEIDLIKMLVSGKLQENNFESGVHQIPQVSSHVLRAGTPENDKRLVPLSDQEKVIIDKLTRGFNKRVTVSIVGMPGLGKTTIAKKVYDKVEHHFHRRAWCVVSQSYVKRDLLLTLLRDIQEFTDEIQEMDDGDLETKVYRCLKRKKYLIVLDDVWDVDVLKDLERVFPDDRNYSRIMITTRHRMENCEHHSLRVLSEVESWKLMEMRIFQKEGCCPKELQGVGKEIAKQCKGLPLAVVAVAGILETTEKKLNLWRRISEELNTIVIEDPVTRCKGILELSYNHLPAHLKACFLYFGAFQEDRDVPARKLIQLWMAEGFIPKIEERTMEEIGEVYLRDLIDRSLILISQMKSTGGVKACRIHDLLLELCRSTSEGNRFLQIKTSKDTPYDSFHYLDDDEDFDPDDPPHSAKYEHHRVCVHLKRKHFVYSRPSAPCTRSLLFFASGDTYPRHPYDMSFIFENFELLRVLDLESINLGSSISAAIKVLVLLRYLALSGDLDSIPQSISNLWKLQTFIVKGLSGKVLLPDTFWCMTSLRHVHVKNRAAFKKTVNFENANQLENLVTFSSPTLSYGQETEKMLRKLPNLRKFRCIFRESWESSGQCNPFPRLDFLDKLESLNIKYSGRGDCNPHQFHLSPNLRKLTLSKFHLSMNHLSTIGKLPKLEVLKMLSGSLEKHIWNMNEDEFKELKYLKLESLEIVEWNASSDNLPQLQQLVLWNCKDLEKISPDLFYVCTLEIVEVRRCSTSLEQYIREIGEQIGGIKILISQ